MKKWILGFLVLMAQTSNAFLSLSESGDLLTDGQLRIGLEPQFRISDGGASNFSLFLDSALREDMNWRLLVGTGDTDLVFQGSLKWIPVPDYQKQPALGLRTDVALGRDSDETFWTLRLVPLMSKQVDTDYVLFTPYIAPTLGFTGVKGTSTTFSQLILGSEIRPHELERWAFSAELGTNISKSFSHLAFTVTYLLDGPTPKGPAVPVGE